MPERLAVVTGASAGIGWEMARQLAARGYDLLLVARREERLKELASHVETAAGRKAEIFIADLTQPGDRDELGSRMAQLEDRLSLVVNNAGLGFAGPTLAAPMERIGTMIELNIAAVTELSYKAAQIMIRKRAGSLINVASTAAFQGVPYMNVYSATKAYVLSFTEALAEELSALGIRVMALCPGYTKSEFHAVAGVRKDDRRVRTAMSAAECVRLGLEDFDRGKRVSVTGWGNKLQVFGSWLVPRNLVLKIVAGMMKDRAAHNSS